LIEVKDQILNYLPLIHKWHNEPRIGPKIGCTKPPDVQETAKLLMVWKKDPARRVFMIEYKGSYIGYVSLSGINLECGFCDLHTIVGETKYLGKPVCVEVVDKILGIAFNEMKMFRVNTYVLGDNPALRKVAIKYGWKEEGIIRKLLLSREGERIDCHLFGMLKNEFKPRRKKCQ